MSSLTRLKYFASLSSRSVPHPTHPCGSQLSECIAHFWSFVFKHCVRAGEKVQPDDLSSVSRMFVMGGENQSLHYFN